MCFDVEVLGSYGSPEEEYLIQMCRKLEMFPEETIITRPEKPVRVQLIQCGQKDK